MKSQYIFQLSTYCSVSDDWLIQSEVTEYQAAGFGGNCRLSRLFQGFPWILLRTIEYFISPDNTEGYQTYNEGSATAQ